MTRPTLNTSILSSSLVTGGGNSGRLVDDARDICEHARVCVCVCADKVTSTMAHIYQRACIPHAYIPELFISATLKKFVHALALELVAAKVFLLVVCVFPDCGVFCVCLCSRRCVACDVPVLFPTPIGRTALRMQCRW